MSENTTQEQPPAQPPAEPPPLTAEDVEVIVKSNRALQQALDQDLNLTSEVEMVIREHTRGTITQATLETIRQGLEFSLGADNTNYLLTVLTKGDDQPYIEQVKRVQAAPKTWLWLRRLLALYGKNLQEANTVGGVNEHSWRVINRRAFFDAVTGNWGVTLQIVKYNGETVLLDETLESALMLANGVLDTLTRVPPEMASNAMARDVVGRLGQLSVELIKLYAPDMLEESATPTEPGEHVNRCSQCGQLLRQGAKFCPHCGKKQ